MSPFTGLKTVSLVPLGGVRSTRAHPSGAWSVPLQNALDCLGGALVTAARGLVEVKWAQCGFCRGPPCVGWRSEQGIQMGFLTL